MLLFMLQGLAFDQCPDPPRPYITDVAVRCEQEELEVSVVTLDGTRVDAVEMQVWTPTGELVATDALVLEERVGDEATFVSAKPRDFSCHDRTLLRFVATNVAGQTGQRDRWLNAAVAVQNGGFEEDLWSWGVGGNGEVTWQQYGVAPLDPYVGDAMLMLGWPSNGYYVYGYAWQNLGELPAGEYQIDFRYAVGTHGGNINWDGSCKDEPSFFYGFNGYTEQDSFENYAADEWTLADHCADLTEAGAWYVTDWKSESVRLDVPASREDQDTFLWFNSYGGYSQWGHWVYLDEVYITPPATETDWLAASVLGEPTWIGDLLSYPVEEPDYPTWFYWDHFEEEVDEAYLELCGDGCVAMSGKYGPEKQSPSDDVDGVWGFDGAVLHVSDESVLLIETKTTAGSCFEDDEEGLQAAQEYIEERREASAKELAKCEYQECAQLSALWIEGTIRDLCAEESGQRRLAAARIEDAWDEGTLYVAWAAVGFEPPGSEAEECLTGWMLPAEPAPPKTRDEALCPTELE